MNQKYDNDDRFIQKYFFNQKSKSVLMLIYSDEDELLALKFKNEFIKNHNVLMLKVNITQNLLKIQNITSKDETRDILTKISIIWENMKKNLSNTYQYMVISIGHGCWPGMQLVMRRHECKIFASINPNLSYDDYLFFTPAPCSGIMIYENDKDYEGLKTLYDKMVFKNSGRVISLEKNTDSFNQVNNFFKNNMQDAFDFNIKNYDNLS